MGFHIVRSYVENTAENFSISEDNKEILIRYYKCTFIGILLDWLDSGASYDLVNFLEKLCDLFSGAGERAFLKYSDQTGKH